MDIREGMRFLLGRSGVSGFTRPDEFDLCGCCSCEAPRIYRSIRDKWNHSLAHLRPISRGNACSGILIHSVWTGPDDPRAHLSLGPEIWARLSRIGEDYLLPRFTDGNPISKYVTFAVLIVELVWRHDIWYPCRL